MPPFHEDDRVTVHHGDALDVLRTLPDCSVDSVVTDPPAGVSFMGAHWDADKGGRDAWVAWLASVLAECRRVLKPGGHALVWALPRTSGWTHRAIEDAGLDIRDCITHLFGSGFPKSLDVGKAIDRQANAIQLWDDIRQHIRDWRDRAGITNTQVNEALGLRTTGSGMMAHWTRTGANQQAIPTKDLWLKLKALLGWPDCDLDAAYANVKDGAERPVIGERTTGIGTGRGAVAYIADSDDRTITAPATEDAARWDGWGTALKPSSEMWYLARRPLAGTVAANVVAHGTGALNIAATRVPGALGCDPNRFAKTDGGSFASFTDRPPVVRNEGRWPSNVVLSHAPTCTEDGCEPSCPVAELDAQSGTTRSTAATGVRRHGRSGGIMGAEGALRDGRPEGHSDQGGASRFFPVFRYQAKAPTRERPKVDGVAHPTCKPRDLMRFLVRLITPPGGTVLDPFAGSGTTAEAAILEGFRCITIEREAEYLPLILARIQRQQPAVEPRPAAQQMSLLDDPAA